MPPSFFYSLVGVGLEVRRRQVSMSQSPESAATAFVPTMSPSKLSAKRRQSADVPAASDCGANAQFEKRPRPMERWSGVPAEEPSTPASYPEASLALRRLESQLDAERKGTEVASKGTKAVGSVPRTPSPVVQYEVRYELHEKNNEQKMRNVTEQHPFPPSIPSSPLCSPFLIIILKAMPSAMCSRSCEQSIP